MLGKARERPGKRRSHSETAAGDSGALWPKPFKSLPQAAVGCRLTVVEVELFLGWAGFLPDLTLGDHPVQVLARDAHELGKLGVPAWTDQLRLVHPGRAGGCNGSSAWGGWWIRF